MFVATAIEVMIASPSDVGQERHVVREAISTWNALHSKERKTILMPIGWETHSSPDLSGRAQEIINDRILKSCDLLIGIFWARLGSKTGDFPSGTVEEIKRHHSEKRPVMIYFSNAPIPQDKMDYEQFAGVQELKIWAFENGIVGTYDNLEDLSNKLQKNLTVIIRENPHLMELIGNSEVDRNVSLHQVPRSLSKDGLELLAAASKSQHGAIISINRYIGGTSIEAGDEEFGDSENPRDVARWRAAVLELSHMGLIYDLNGKGEAFEITNDGYLELERTR